MNPEAKIHFISFADGSFAFKLAGKRILSEAISMKVFESVTVWSLEKIKLITPDIGKRISKKYIQDGRGCGYWSWKPFIILETLNKIANNEFVLYADAGCELINNEESIKTLRYMAESSADLILQDQTDSGYGTRKFGASEKIWTKNDLLDLTKLNSIERNLPQLGATWILMRKTDKTIELVQDWLELAFSKNFHYIDDSPSISTNESVFQEHRHDQSILSCLIKSKKLATSKKFVEGSASISGKVILNSRSLGVSKPNRLLTSDITQVIRYLFFTVEKHLLRYSLIRSLHLCFAKRF